MKLVFLLCVATHSLDGRLLVYCAYFEAKETFEYAQSTDNIAFSPNLSKIVPLTFRIQTLLLLYIIVFCWSHPCSCGMDVRYVCV